LLYVTNTQAYQQKTEKFFASAEKKFYRIGYSLESLDDRKAQHKKILLKKWDPEKILNVYFKMIRPNKNLSSNLNKKRGSEKKIN